MGVNFLKEEEGASVNVLGGLAGAERVDRVARHGGVPPYPETRAYVAALTGDAQAPASPTPTDQHRNTGIWEF